MKPQGSDVAFHVRRPALPSHRRPWAAVLGLLAAASGLAVASPSTGKPVVYRGVAVANGRAMQLFGGSSASAARFAETVNAYAARLGPSVAVYSIVVPTAVSFYLPESGSHLTNSEKANILAGKEKLAPGVKFVDCYPELEKHAGEYLYFRSDTHWTVRAAYYTYVAFCAAAGFQPVPLDSMERRVSQTLVGSLYSYTKDRSILETPDFVESFVPPVPYEAYRMTGPMRDVPVEAFFVDRRLGGYITFLGGDHPLLIGKTQAKTRRRALLVKNSYGNPFAPFLLNHFEEVLVIDYRSFEGNVVSLVDDYEITDVLILNPTLTANAASHCARTLRILDQPARSQPGKAASSRSRDGTSTSKGKPR